MALESWQNWIWNFNILQTSNQNKVFTLSSAKLEIFRVKREWTSVLFSMSHSNVPMNHVWFVSYLFDSALLQCQTCDFYALFFWFSLFCFSKTSSFCQHSFWTRNLCLNFIVQRGQDHKSRWYSWTIADVQKDEDQCKGTEGLRT